LTELPFGIPDAKLVEDPAGGVILVGGRSLESLDTLFRLAHAEATEWKLMPQRLKVARKFHTAFMIPGIFVIIFFSLLLMIRLNKLECLYMAITFQFSLTFDGNTRSLPKKEASERSSNWVCSGLARKIPRPNWKGFPRANLLAYWALSSVTKGKRFITLTSGQSSTYDLWAT